MSRVNQSETNKTNESNSQGSKHNERKLPYPNAVNHVKTNTIQAEQATTVDKKHLEHIEREIEREDPSEQSKSYKSLEKTVETGKTPTSNEVCKNYIPRRHKDHQSGNRENKNDIKAKTKQHDLEQNGTTSKSEKKYLRREELHRVMAHATSKTTISGI